MIPHRVLIIGTSMYAEALQEMLARSGELDSLEMVPDLDAASCRLNASCPDVVILPGPDPKVIDALAWILARCTKVSVICMDPASEKVQIVTSKQTRVRYANFLSLIANLSERSETHDET